jgi:hypothetical protein
MGVGISMQIFNRRVRSTEEKPRSWIDLNSKPLLLKRITCKYMSKRPKSCLEKKNNTWKHNA